jgi:hypothetical protein
MTITQQIRDRAWQIAVMATRADWPEGYLYRATSYPGLGGYVFAAAARTATREL